MAKRKREGGLTLVEILLALLVMVLGLLGILALFPQALQSSRESVEETTSAILSESVAHAFKNAVQFGKEDTTANQWICVMTHDLKSMGTYVRYPFILPKLTDGWKHFPYQISGDYDPGKTPTAPTGNTDQEDGPEKDPCFQLCGDQWIYATVDNVRQVNDPSDPYAQYAFSFVVRKVNTLDYLYPGTKGAGPQINPKTSQLYTMTDLEPLTKVYELRVRIFRIAVNAPAGGGGTTTTGGTAGASRKKLISEMSYRVGTR